MPRRIRTARQIALGFVAAYTLASLLLGLGVYVIGDRALRDALDDRVEAESAILAEVHRRLGLDGLVQALRRRDSRGVNNLGYLLVDTRGHRLGGELETRPPAPGWGDIVFRDEDEVAAARALTTRLPDGARLTVAMELQPADDLRRATFIFFALGAGAMAIGGLLGGLLLSRAIRARLDGMNGTALAIIGGDMSQRVPEGPRDDEFRRLAITLNRMLDRNSALIENLRQVSNDIAHDLRTPIAHLRQRLERASALAPADSPAREEIGNAIRQSDAILSLFGSLLRISEVESGALRRTFTPVDLSATVEAICESYCPAAEDGGRVLVPDIAPDLTLSGIRELVAQALINVLENALRHTPVGTRITLRLERASTSTAMLVVEDDGPGVPADLLPTLTKRFVRSDKSRGTPGFGLGLNLVQAVVSVHEGTLTLRNTERGFRVAMTFPLVPGAKGRK